MTSTNGTSAQASSLHRLSSLYFGDGLPDALDLLDQLHTAASEGHLPRATTLSQDEVIGLLQDLIFVAQETLDELGAQQRHQRVAARHDVILKLVQKR
jgi:hypothetical protein